MTKLEQVARAIADALNMDQNPHMYEPEDTLRAARAAMEAVREPTDDMLDYRDALVKKSDALLVWRHQIDAILSEKPDA